MLLVKTYVAPSEIAGLGLFAAEPIPINHPVWVDNSTLNIVLTPEQVANLPPVSQEYIEKYAWTDKDGGKHIGVDADKYTNHSDNPNCVWIAKGLSVARRPIAVGEEITEDYTTYKDFDD